MKKKTAALVAAFVMGQVAQYIVTVISTSFAPDQQLVFCAGTGAVVVLAFLVGTRVPAGDEDAIRPILPAAQPDDELLEEFTDENKTA